MEGNIRVTFGFIKFFSIYLGSVSCKITFFITGNAPLIIKIFNNKTDILLFLILSCFFLFCAFIYNSLLIFLSYIYHLKYLLWKVKHELRVTSSDSRVTSSNPRVTSSNSRVTSSNSRVTSSNPRVRRLKARVARLKALVARLKARVRRLKARVEAIKPRVR